MSHTLRKIGIFILSLTLITVSVFPVIAGAEQLEKIPAEQQTKNPTVGANIGEGIVNFIFNLSGGGLSIILHAVMQIVAGILGLSGMILDGVMKLTIVEMAERIKNMTAINDVWKVIRDLGNMSFIFILLYHGIRMVLGLGSSDVKKVIGGIVMAAVLVNFSLFFTKALIDISNVVTLGFYNSLSNSSGQLAVPAGSTSDSVASSTFDFTFSGAFMKPLGVSGLFSKEGFAALGTGVASMQGGKLAVFYICAIIFMLLCTFVFLAVSVMFVARFIGVIILLIMSPVAFLSMAIPGLEGAKKKYWGTLSSQLLFGPLYMLYSWVILNLMGPGGLISGSEKSLGEAILNPNVGTVTVIINFIILIGLLITSVVEAKKQATSGGILTNKWLDKGQEYLGGAVFGGTSWLGRSTLGRYGQKISEDKDLKERAARGDLGARFKLLAGNKLATSSFDARNTKTMELATGDIAGLGKIGGFGKPINTKGYRGYVEQELKEKTEADKKRAEQFKVPEDKASLEEYEKQLKDDPTLETNKRDSRKIILSTLIEEEQEKVKSQVDQIKPIITKLTEEKEKFEKDKKKIEEDIQRSREMILMASQVGDSATVEIYTATLQKEEEQLKTLTESLTDATNVLQEKKKELNEINSEVLKLQLEAKEIEDNIWISPEYEKLIADAGGRKEEKNKKTNVVTKKAVSSTSNTNILAYAERVKNKTGLFSGIPNIRIDSNFSKRRAEAVRKLTKAENNTAKLEKLIKEMNKEAEKEEEDKKDDAKATPAPASAPAAPTPTTPNPPSTP